MVAHDGGMVDVSAKNVTLRMAKASSSIILGDEAFTTLKVERVDVPDRPLPPPPINSR